MKATDFRNNKGKPVIRRSLKAVSSRRCVAFRPMRIRRWHGGRPKSSMSHHFRILRDAGLVHTRAAGTIHQNTLRATELNARFPGLLKAILAQVPDGNTVTAERKR
jgi:hypothetical protein